MSANELSDKVTGTTPQAIFDSCKTWLEEQMKDPVFASNLERAWDEGRIPGSPNYKEVQIATPEKGEPVYDADTCITAGELRAMGCTLPDTIPDCGWVPRSAMIVSTAVDKSRCDEQILAVDAKITLTEPFRWIEVPVIVKKMVQDKTVI